MIVTSAMVKQWRRERTADDLVRLEGQYWTEAYILRCGIRNMKLVGEGYGYELPGDVNYAFYTETVADIHRGSDLVGVIMNATEMYKGYVQKALALHIITMQRRGETVTDETVIVAPNGWGEYRELRKRFEKVLF